MPPFGWPSVLAAGAAGAYATQNISSSGTTWDILRGLRATLDGSGASTSGRGAGSITGTGEIQTLQGEIDRLHRLLSEAVRGGGRGQGALVIHTGPGGRTWLWLPAAGVLLTMGYCKLRGWSVMDMLYVSRGSLANFRDYVSEGFTKMWDELRRQKDQLLQSVAGVDAKQQQLMQQNEAMDHRLRQVGNSVDDIKDSTNKINSHMRQLDQRMVDMHNMVGHSSTGIMLLCHVLGEITSSMGKQNSRAVQALKNFIGGTGSPLTGAASGSGGTSSLTAPWDANFVAPAPASTSAPLLAAAPSAAAVVVTPGVASQGSVPLPPVGLAGLGADLPLGGAKYTPSAIVHDEVGTSMYKGASGALSAESSGFSVGGASSVSSGLHPERSSGLYGVQRMMSRG